MASRRLVSPEITEQLTFNITIHIFHHISQLESHNTKQHKILSQLKMLILPLLIHTMSTLYITHSKPRRYLSCLFFLQYQNEKHILTNTMSTIPFLKSSFSFFRPQCILHFHTIDGIPTHDSQSTQRNPPEQIQSHLSIVPV